jgi:hypothetical protein
MPTVKFVGFFGAAFKPNTSSFLPELPFESALLDAGAVGASFLPKKEFNDMASEAVLRLLQRSSGPFKARAKVKLN